MGLCYEGFKPHTEKFYCSEMNEIKSLRLLGKEMLYAEDFGGCHIVCHTKYITFHLFLLVHSSFQTDKNMK